MGTEKAKYAAPAAGCAAEVLLALSRRGQALTVTDLAGHTGYTKSLVYRVINELEARDYVTRRADGTYWLGLSAVEIGGAFSATVPLMTSVRTVLRRLADQTGETANLGVLQGDQVLYLMREEGPRSVLALSHVGKRLPANCVALGKALLSVHSDAEVRGIFASRLNGDGRLAALTPASITSLPKLLAELATVREHGFAEEHGEAVPGRGAAAIPVIFDQHHLRHAAVSISIYEDRFREIREDIIAALQETKGQIEREVRGRAALSEGAIVQVLDGDIY